MSEFIFFETKKQSSMAICECMVHSFIPIIHFSIHSMCECVSCAYQTPHIFLVVYACVKQNFVRLPYPQESMNKRSKNLCMAILLLTHLFSKSHNFDFFDKKIKMFIPAEQNQRRQTKKRIKAYLKKLKNSFSWSYYVFKKKDCDWMEICRLIDRSKSR